MTDISRDPEIAELQKETLRLIISSEKILTALEDHVALLRTFVDKARETSEAEDIMHEHERTHHEQGPTDEQ